MPKKKIIKVFDKLKLKKKQRWTKYVYHFLSCKQFYETNMFMFCSYFLKKIELVFCFVLIWKQKWKSMNLPNGPKNDLFGSWDDTRLD